MSKPLSSLTLDLVKSLSHHNPSLTLSTTISSLLPPHLSSKLIPSSPFAFSSRHNSTEAVLTTPQYLKLNATKVNFTKQLNACNPHLSTMEIASALPSNFNRYSRSFSSATPEEPETIQITYIDNNDEPSSSVTVTAQIPSTAVPVLKTTAGGVASSSQTAQLTGVPRTLMDLAHAHDIELEGACGGELSCSTCHLIFHPEDYAILMKMPGMEKSEEEEDMLDLAWGLEKTSRLGCQIKLCKGLDGMRVTIPAEF